MILIRNGQLLAALGTTGSQYATSVLRCHSLTKSVFVDATAVVWLKCSFHLFICILLLLCYLRAPTDQETAVTGCKITQSFGNNQRIMHFYYNYLGFFLKKAYLCSRKMKIQHIRY